MNYLFYIFFGLAPGIIWLLLYLRKDAHPEPNRMILKIFFYGMLATIPAALLQLGFSNILKYLGLLNLSMVLAQIVYLFLGVAMSEEVVKYLAVKKGVFKNPALDEPIDVMLYMIIAGLGFATVENLLILFPLIDPFRFFELFLISFIRFWGATFLHALCSGIFGYFLALSFFETKNRTKFFLIGLGIATLLHGFYNLSIITIEGYIRFVIPIMILIGLAVFVYLGFGKLKKLKSVCKIT